MKYINLFPQKITLTVFRTLTHEIVNQIFSRLEVLISPYDLTKIHSQKERNDFYAKRSSILSSWSLDLKPFKKYLDKYKIDYISSRGYQPTTNQYVLNIEGQNPRKEYVDAPEVIKPVREKIIPTEALKNYALRSQEKKYPLYTETLEEAVAYVQAVKCIYEKDLFLTGNFDVEFDINLYNQFIRNMKSCNVKLIILGNDLAQLEQKEDFAILLLPVIQANQSLADQYKAGNEKSLNALLGKFLKDNKGYDPKEIKEELIKLINL